jgi:hypothetical protein
MKRSNAELQSGKTLTNADVEEAAIEGAVHRCGQSS